MTTSTHPPVKSPVAAARDVLKYERHPLNGIFKPRSVAVIGASEKAGSVGRTILWNLISSPFGGTVYPVNPKRASILGVKAYPDTAARMFNYTWLYNYNLRTLYETPVLPADEGSAMNREQARHIIQAARQEGRTLLTELESKQLLGAYGTPSARA